MAKFRAGLAAKTNTGRHQYPAGGGSPRQTGSAGSAAISHHGHHIDEQRRGMIRAAGMEASSAYHEYRSSRRTSDDPYAVRNINGRYARSRRGRADNACWALQAGHAKLSARCSRADSARRHPFSGMHLCIKGCWLTGWITIAGAASWFGVLRTANLWRPGTGCAWSPHQSFVTARSH